MLRRRLLDNNANIFIMKPIIPFDFWCLVFGTFYVATRLEKHENTWPSKAIRNQLQVDKQWSRVFFPRAGLLFESGGKVRFSFRDGTTYILFCTASHFFVQIYQRSKYNGGCRPPNPYTSSAAIRHDLIQSIEQNFTTYTYQHQLKIPFSGIP